MVQKIIDWARRLAWLWGVLVPSSVVGALTGWIASGAKWLNQYGLIAWWFAGLLGFLVTAFALGGVAWLRFQWLKGSAIADMKRPVDSINPLDSVFTNRRIDINVFKSPIGQPVPPKTFVNCELVGPANIYFVKKAMFKDIDFGPCDFVELKDGARMTNVIAFENITITGGRIFFLTILVPKQMRSQIPQGANWITA
jgi:hypothetical protein